MRGGYIIKFKSRKLQSYLDKSKTLILGRRELDLGKLIVKAYIVDRLSHIFFVSFSLFPFYFVFYSRLVILFIFVFYFFFFNFSYKYTSNYRGRYRKKKGKQEAKKRKIHENGFGRSL